MKTPCLVVMPKNSLLNHALSSLLHADASLVLLDSHARDEQELLAEISRLGTEFIFMAESAPLASKEALISILVTHPSLCVVVVSENSNWLQVFRKSDVLLTQSKDLLNIFNLS
jgi:hypothetical protein